MIIVGRPINGITLNPLEYLLDDDGKVKKFPSKKQAVSFLKEKGFTDDDIYWLTFEKTKKSDLGNSYEKRGDCDESSG